MIGARISHYRIIDYIGKGGMGVVYRAVDERLNRTVAIKMLPPQFAADEQRKRRLLKEAQAASALSHANICTIYGIEESDNNFFVIMEYLAGHTLAEEIDRGPLQTEHAVKTAIEIAKALEIAHSHNIVHRDVKPSNIFITEQGHIKVLDFGLAHIMTDVNEQALSQVITAEQRLTETGTVIGTLHYMSPEQLRGKRVDGRTDIYSFGVVLYEMLSGKLPFQGDTLYTLMSAILNEEAPPLNKIRSGIPLSLHRAIEKAMKKDPAGRYASIQEMSDDLRKMHERSDAGEKQDRTIAVLYFENLGGEREEEYFRDGMTEDIITELSRIRELKVFPRSAVIAFRDKPFGAAELGKELNTSYILEGSLRRSGERVRINASLVQTSTGHSIWAERYDRKLQDMFDLQDEIARSIASALRISISAQEEEAIAKKPTDNTVAYDCYLRARSFTRRVNYPDLEYALEMLERAISLQPDFALAYASMARVCSLIYFWHGEDPAWIEKGRFAGDRALKLQPELPEAMEAHGEILLAQKKYDQAIEYELKAIQMKPSCEGAYWTLGRGYFLTNRLEEGLQIVTSAIAAAGDDYNVYIPFILMFERLDKQDEALSLREKQTVVLERQLEMVPEDARARMFLAHNYAVQRNEAAAIQHLKRAIGLRPNDTHMLYNAACLYGILQKRTQALTTLKKAVAVGFRNADWAKQDPHLQCLQDDPSFHRLLEEMRRTNKKSRTGKQTAAKAANSKIQEPKIK